MTLNLFFALTFYAKKCFREKSRPTIEINSFSDEGWIYYDSLEDMYNFSKMVLSMLPR